MRATAKNKLITLLAFLGVAYIAYKAVESKQEEKESEKMPESSTDSLNQQLYYGVSGGSNGILTIINQVAETHPMNANLKDLKAFLFEIIATETDFGTAKDNTRNSGEGLTQFDKTTYEELRKELLNKGMNVYDLYNTDYSKLRENPYLSVFMARYFLYRRIPAKIPNTIELRAKQWKQYYNTIYGAGTEAHYIKMSNKWYKKLGVTF